MGVKRVVVLGSTGSIGINTLNVIEQFPGRFKVVGLTAYNNFRLLEKQIKKFLPTHVAVSSPGIDYLRRRVSTKKVRILDVETEVSDIVALPKVERNWR